MKRVIILLLLSLGTCFSAYAFPGATSFVAAHTQAAHCWQIFHLPPICV